MRWSAARWLACAIATLLIPIAVAQQALVVKPLTEKKVDTLPAGELVWRIDNLASLEQAKALAGQWSLAAESAGKVWLFTLGAAGGSSPGATRIAEVGPIPRVDAAQYLLRINEASGPPGAVTSVHSHPGSEAFYVLAGEQSIKSASDVMRVRAGQAEAGQGPGRAMQVSSSGSTDLHALVMFVVDAGKPFSSPGTMP
jgi:quercetin dioxygenase-like cupin family protein